MLHLLWCLFTVSSAACLSYILRGIVYRITESTTTQLLFDEFTGNFVCAVALLEIFIITFAEHSLYLFFAATYIVLFIRNVYFVYHELYETPLIFIDLYYGRGRVNSFSALHIITVVLVQSLACVCGQIFVRYAWPHLDAVHQAANQEKCLTTMSHAHNWYECFALEMLGTFACTVFDFQMPNGVKPLTRPLLLCLALHYFGHVTGAWMNPMLASAFTFRCHGHDSDIMHFIVFWIAPVAGFALAWEVHLFFKGLFDILRNYESSDGVVVVGEKEKEE